MYYLIYSSYASREFSEEELLDMLIHWRANNTSMGITGILLCFNNKFIQLLEGEEQDVQQMYALIRVDDRHHHVETLKETPIERRMFAKWSMKFSTVSKAQLDDDKDYESLTQNPLKEDDVLKLFRLLGERSDLS